VRAWIVCLHSASIGLLSVSSALITLSSALAAEPVVKPVGKPYVYKTVGDRELRLYVVEPQVQVEPPAQLKPPAQGEPPTQGDLHAPGETPRPAAVFFHGGGWVGGTPKQFNDLAEHLAQRGMVAVQVEYRLLPAKSNDPPTNCVRDAKSALRWVRAHARELNVDPNRIAAGGGSAGGHLAAFVGMVEGNDDPADDATVSPKANALLLFNPVYDNGPDDGWGQARVADRYQEFSPAHNITKDDPPAIVFLGTKDNLIPVAVAERFQKKMLDAGIRSDLHLFEDQPHGFFNQDPFKSQTIAASDAFLTSLGWLPPTKADPQKAHKRALSVSDGRVPELAGSKRLGYRAEDGSETPNKKPAAKPEFRDGGAARRAAKPNILFILTDDQSRGTLGCYGGTRVATPHLDGLAREGLLFTDAYVMPQCTPTRASLLTGQHTARNGLWHVLGWYGYPWAPVNEPAFAERLPRSAFTVGKGLRAAGYATGMAGKWHLTGEPDGSYSRLNESAADAYGFDYVAPPGPGTPGQGDKWVNHLTDSAAGFIERNRDRPWFFYLAHHTIHSVVAAPAELVAEFRAAGAPETGMHNALYLAAIKHLDNSVGRLLSKLEELGERDDTLVVFMSDNGGIDGVYDQADFSKGAGGGLTHLRVEREEYDNRPFRAGKGSPYEGGIRAPCIVRWPGVVKAGSRTETPIHVIDWLPTLLDVAGLEVAGAAAPADTPINNAVIDGVSLAPLLRGEALAPRPLYWYMPLYDLRWGATPCAVIRDGDWKLIDYFGDSFDAAGDYRPGARSELFNLRDDPGEEHDLSATNSARATVLREQLRGWLGSIPVPVPAANPHHDPKRSFSETREKQPWYVEYAPLAR